MASRSTEAGEEIGGYRVRSRVAVGGMGEIFAAESSDGRRVALKVLLPQLASTAEGRAAFAHEAEIGERLRHDNIVSVRGHGDDPRGPFIVLEWIDGASLAACIGEMALPVEALLVVARDLLMALDQVHRATDSAGEPLAIVHRDLSPDNVMIGRAGEAKLTDFGIARSRLRDRRTKTGLVRGKVHYLSPEQITGSEVDARSDLYALGCVLFELATRQPFIAGDSDLEVLQAAQAPVFRSPSSLGADAALDPLLERALARFPEERFQSARAMQKQVDALLANLGDGAIARGRTELAARAERAALPFPAARAPVASRSRALALAVAAAAGVGAVVLLGTMGRRDSDGPATAPLAAPSAQGDAAAPPEAVSDSLPEASEAPPPPASEAAEPLAAPSGSASEKPRKAPTAVSTASASAAPPASASTLATVEAPTASSADTAAKLQGKMKAVSERLKRAKASGRDVSGLEARSAIALQALLDGRYEDTNRELDAISAALPP